MRTSCAAALDGTALHELDERIIVQAIKESKPDAQYSFGQTARRIGQFVTGFERQYLDVTVQFAICQMRGYQDRAEILDRVNEWANHGGFLTVNYRPGKRLRVVCCSMPEVGAVREWTAGYQIVFRTLGCPFWENDAENAFFINVPACDIVFSQKLSNEGTEPAPLMVSVQGGDEGTQISAVQVSIGEQSIRMTGLALTKNDVLRMEEDAYGIYQLTVNGSSAQHRRTVESCDMLMLPPGEHDVRFMAEGVGSARFRLSVRGRWV